MRKTGADWLAQLKSNDQRVAHDARLFLGGLGPSESWMLDDLVAGTHASDDYTRFWAATALKRLGTTALPAAQQIRLLLDDPYPAVRQVAADSVLSVTPPSDGVEMLLTVARSDEITFVRDSAIRALLRVPEGSRAAVVTGLVPLLADLEVACPTAITLKCLLLDEGGIPKGVHRKELRSALAHAAGSDQQAVASQAKSALQIATRDLTESA